MTSGTKHAGASREEICVPLVQGSHEWRTALYQQRGTMLGYPQNRVNGLRTSWKARSPLASDGAAAGDVEAVLERITDPVVAYDRRWCFTYLNRRAEECSGRRR
jgi:PAS domain-containing protein